MTGRILTEGEWALLEAAEAPLYPPHSGCFAHTDVMPREESEIAGALWAYAETGAEATCEDEADVPRETAQRVADAFACLAFGREFIDAPARKSENDNACAMAEMRQEEYGRGPFENAVNGDPEPPEYYGARA